MRTLLSLLAVSLTAACTAQAPTADNPLELVVGADGGSLDADGLKMEVPAGAVDSEVTLTAYPTDRVIDGVTTASQTWTFGPDGQTFNTPIMVSLAFTGSHDAATVWWTMEGDTNTFTNQKTTVAGGWAAAAVAHFSEGAVGEDDRCGTESDDDADTGDDADNQDESDSGDETDTAEGADTGDEADGEGEHGHHDEGDDDGDEADGDHGDGGDHGSCQHEDHDDGDDEDADGGDEGDTGEEVDD